MPQIINDPSLGASLGGALETGLSGLLQNLAVKKAQSVRAKRNYEGLIAEKVEPQMAKAMSYWDDKQIVKYLEGHRKGQQASSDQAASQEIMSDQPSRQMPFTGTKGQAVAQGQDPTLNMQRMPFNTQQFPGMPPQAPQGQDVPEMLSGIQQAIQQSPMDMLSKQGQFAPEARQSFPEMLQPAQRSPEEEINWLAGKIQETNAHPSMSTAGKKNQTDQLYKKIEQIKEEREFKFKEEAPHMKGVHKKVSEAIDKGLKAPEQITTLKNMLKLMKRGDLNSPAKIAMLETISSGGPLAAIGSMLGAYLTGGAGGALAGAAGGGLTRGLELGGTFLTPDTQKMEKNSATLFNTAVEGLHSVRNAEAIAGLKRNIANIHQAPEAMFSLIRSDIKRQFKNIERMEFIESDMKKEGKLLPDVMIRAKKHVKGREDSIISEFKKINKEVERVMRQKAAKKAAKGR